MNLAEARFHIKHYAKFTLLNPAYRLREVGQTLADEVERLNAIVAKLQKCWRLNERGKLVQDVPLVPGMKVRSISGETFDVCGCRFRDDSSAPSEAYPDHRSLYLTDEAAQAAGDGEGL